MADLTVTAGSVLTSSTSTRSGTAGVSITAGQWLYIDSSDSNKLKLAISTTAATAAAVGVALHGSLAGQPITYQTSGDYTSGGTMALGDHYYVSGTGGGMQPFADLGASEFVTSLGVAKSTTVFTINISQTGGQRA